MIKLLLLSLLFSLSLFANKVLYINYSETPKRVVKGEIFSVTVKTLSTVGQNEDINYKFSNHRGLEVLSSTPQREMRGKFLFDKFYFLTTKSKAKLPDIRASINDTEYDTSYLRGKRLNVITLNPKENFSNVIADSFELVDARTTSYDNRYNIVVFVAKATNTIIKDMRFNNVYKQGIESSKNDFQNSRITYFVIIDKKLENFSFSYFNLVKNKFTVLNIPIIVDDDSVTTQSDLKPKDQSHDKIKAIIAAIIALILAIFILLKKKYIYLLLITIPLGYIVYITIPSKEICIKQGSRIYLLPVNNGTIFETTQSEYHLIQEGSVERFVKVKLHNDKIGWVKNEDICTY